MNLVFFTHPNFLGSQSMPRYTRMLAEGMRERGHSVTLWSPQPRFFSFPVPVPIKKWMGYVDQFLIFPTEVHTLLKACPADTLFVFIDQALGPWVPLVNGRPHVIHCHDFLAQRAALGLIPENVTGWTGRRYQSMIRRGYSRGKHFISVSEKTREDLHHFLKTTPANSEVVYNGLQHTFKPCGQAYARATLENRLKLTLSKGYLLHVGGNQWYKNRTGVLEIYNAWRSEKKGNLPLLMIGNPPSKTLLQTHQQSPYKESIHLLSTLEDADVQFAYAGASLFLFPSLAEGFGWPIIEAMACGCPVITTNEAPMTTVAGHAAFLLPRRPYAAKAAANWAKQGAELVQEVLNFTDAARTAAIEAGFLNARRFDAKQALDRIEKIYQGILQTSGVL